MTAEIDLQLNTRALAPLYPQISAAYLSLSQSARERLQVTTDLTYGPHPLEKLDVLRYAGPVAGTIVWFHGGLWRARDKHEFHFLSSGFARHGLATVAAGYPKSPDVPLARIVEAAINAVDATAQLLQRLGLPSAPLLVGGHSAGAHLATMAALRRPKLVAGVVALSGLYDLEPVRRSFANEHLNLSQADVQALSPSRLGVRGHCPAVFLVGSDETLEFKRQASRMQETWAGEWAARAELPAADHYTGLFALSGGTPPALRDLLARVLPHL